MHAMWIYKHYVVTTYEFVVVLDLLVCKLQLIAMETFCLIYGLLICEWLQLQVLPTMYCKQEVGNGVVPNHAYPSLFYRGMPRNGSPPWRPDDKDGHYVFAVGENLTPRCR